MTEKILLIMYSLHLFSATTLFPNSHANNYVSNFLFYFQLKTRKMRGEYLTSYLYRSNFLLREILHQIFKLSYAKAFKRKPFKEN